MTELEKKKALNASRNISLITIPAGFWHVFAAAGTVYYDQKPAIMYASPIAFAIVLALIQYSLIVRNKYAKISYYALIPINIMASFWGFFALAIMAYYWTTAMMLIDKKWKTSDITSGNIF